MPDLRLPSLNCEGFEQKNSLLLLFMHCVVSKEFKKFLIKSSTNKIELNFEQSICYIHDYNHKAHKSSNFPSVGNLIQNMKRCKDQGLIGLDNLSVHDHLIQNIVSLLNIVHDVQLAHVLKIFIHCLHQVVNELQICHFIVLLQVDSHDEVEAGVPAVDYLVASVLNE